MISIDQNCHSLWDVAPKLAALGAHGVAVRHLVEDVDVAFTALGGGMMPNLRLERERFYRGGGQDWGAALFYSEFLGRLAVDPRQWEPCTGMRTAVLARHLGEDSLALYDEFSPGDNWQLVGPSYVGDRLHHRVIGDLGADETADFLHEILDIAWADCMRCFPQPPAQQRVEEWFSRERQRLETMLAQCQGRRLVDLYQRWLGYYLPAGASMGLTSSAFACDGEPSRHELLELFLRDYDLLAGLYNQSLDETKLGLRPLDVRAGELPMFAVMDYQGHRVRTGVFLEGRSLRAGHIAVPLKHQRRLPAEALCAAGVSAVAGKAVLLMMQARYGPGGDALALPYRGSIYTPAVHAFTRCLRQANLLAQPLQPIVRVRMRLLDRMAELDTLIHLPPHLARALGRDEVPARELARAWRELAAEAAARLERFRDESFRRQWQASQSGEIARELGELDARRRQLAAVNDKDPQLRAIWKRIKPLRLRMLRRMVEQIALDWQVRDIDYWDSRGGLLPWCVAMGGQEFYNHVVGSAEIYQEPQP
jgi:hypothetical protein